MSEQNQKNAITEALVKSVLVILGLWFLYLVRDVVALFFLSVILTATLDPAIDWLQKRKFPRPFSVFLIYILLFSFIGVAISFLFPPLISQFKDFIDHFPQYSEKISSSFSVIEIYARSYGIDLNIHDILKNSIGGAEQSSKSIFSTTVGVFTVLLSLIVVLSLTFYMSVKEDGMKRFIASLTPKSKREHMTSLVARIQSKIGRWMFGQILLMVIIFVLDFIALSVFNIPYALILALLAGILEIVPYLGPIISATLAASVGFIISPLTGLVVLGVLTAIQQLESHVIVPQVMKKAVGLNPVVVILALLIGAKLGGTIGAILAIPVATAIGVFVKDYTSEMK
jgi:predicted PurR-regulated permease PerM